VAKELRLESDTCIVEVISELGGSLAAFDIKTEAEHLPIMRRWSGKSSNPRSFASSPMVPWFNRISGGGFTFDGVFYPVAPNDPEEPVPLHGDGWHTPWEVVKQSPDTITLRLRSRAIPPFDYEATQVISLSGPTLDMLLSVRHLGPKPIPYGLGQHPWFVRTPAVRLHANATGVWRVQPPAFPESPTPDAIPDKWSFNRPHPLPDDFFDNGYAGWDGRARIEWLDRGIALDIEADATFYHAYSLGADCPIFCFEPVTHPNNALGKPGTPEENGLRVLRTGEETSLRATFTAVTI
jgi:aldose 1-epimerase